MRKSIAVIGLSRFGIALVESLSKLDVDLIAIDQNPKGVKEASEFITHALVADSTDENSLRESGIANVDHVIVAIGQNDRVNLTSSIITIIKLKQLGIKHITARADDVDYVETLKLVGATDVISPLFIASERIANKIAAGNVIDYFNIKNDFDVYEIKIGDNFETTPILNVDLRTKYKANILLIERNKKVIVPSKDDVLMPGDDIFVFGRKQDLSKVTEYFK